MFRKVVMAATVLILLMMVIITPKLLGRSDISTFPTLRFTLQGGQVYLLVTSISGDYLYRQIILVVDNNSIESFHGTVGDAFSLSTHVPASDDARFNVTAEATDQTGATYKFDTSSFILRAQTTGWTVYVNSPNESRTFRQVDIPGGIPPTFSIIFPRRVGP